MKRRVVRPYKILAVALGATLGCSTSPRPDTGATTSTTAAPAKPVITAAAPAIPPIPPPDAKVPAALLALRGELGAATPEQLRSSEAHFRPLCDKDGYPLVGNLNQKGPPEGNTPSAFCAALRTKKPS